MAPTYPDWTRCHKLCDVPSYAASLNCCPPYKGEAPKKFEFPTDLPMRTRVAAHSVDDSYVDDYALAIQRMKELPHDDPRNFMQQANVHAAYCHSAYYMGKTNKAFKVHGGWFFLPWHRWYLYFYERILAKLLGDNTFALPFWNWDFEDGMMIPPMYMYHSSPLYDEKRNRKHGTALMDLGYSQGCDHSFMSRDDLIWRNYKIMFHQIVVVGACTRAFHGEKIKENIPTCTCGSGTLEQMPHNTVHDWTGTVPIGDKHCPCPSKTCYGEDMGIFYSAARDPIFYAHHANVDRLWTIWKTLPGREDYKDRDLLDTKFFFYDENKDLVEVRAGDAFDPEKLRYEYEDSPTPWLRRPFPWVMEPIASAAISMASRRAHETHFDGVGGFAVRTLDLQANPSFTMPTKMEVSRQPRNISFEGEPRHISFQGGPPLLRRPSAFHEVLVIEGIRVQRNIGVKFDVFVQLDDWLASTRYVDTMPPQYAGSFVELPRGEIDDVDAGCGQSSMRLVLSEVLRDLGFGQKEESIVVTLIPKVNLQQPIRISAVKIEHEWS